jgi:hypothetical protein
MALLGLGLILAVSLVFLAVGRSEDAERAASGRPDGQASAPAPGRGKLRPRGRLPRRRDHD